jgi:hypothetical protein
MQQCNTVAFGRIYIVNHPFLPLLLSVLIITSVSFKSAQAHVFSPDKTASLLAVANQLRSELKLIGNSLEYSDYNLALKHLADITAIQSRKNITPSFSIHYLDELRKLIESMPANSDQQKLLLHINETIDNSSRFLDDKVIPQVAALDLRNSTIQALIIANMTDEILREYAIAHGIEPAVTNSGSMGSLMNMNIQNMTSSVDSSSASTNMEPNGMGQMETNRDKSSPLSTSRIANISNYQNAQELAIRTFEIFRDELKPLDLPNTTRSFLTTELRSSSVTGLEEGLILLLDSINDKKPYSDIMQIVHGPVHTNLFLAYDLKMVAE